MTRRPAEIFHEARELPAAQRESYLRGACGDDAALRAHVDSLLDADANAGGFMASPTSGVDVRVDTAAPQEQPGALIGRYKLLEQIGEGGMGTIWMAEQREPVKRRVALKIIKLGMDTKQVIARFEAERQALAMMDHPNIAKVLDAGATDAGRPYFVMEYIKGIPILEYCDLEKVDTKARLTLFADVCNAIQHAHQKGIIHRDIKPDNVLVTMHDGVPVPKVIDFGIAKATNAELTTKTLFTEHRQMVGTPAYMSPEQAEMSGLDIDTRSDVYSLGVLLYELLTGTTPFDMKKLIESGFAEMMRTIREVEPHKPSTRISTLGQTASRTAQLRHVDSKKLGTLLRGDLDWIVMKCLEKDRTRRYDTANGLAADIKRHLSNEPVTAGAPSSAYRLRKFVKRNRVQVLATGAVTAALVLGIIAFAWQAKEAREQRDLAVTAKNSEAEQRRAADAARTEAQKHAKRANDKKEEARQQEAAAKRQAAIAEAIAKFQTDMLAAADPDKLLGDKVTVVQAMEAAVKELDRGSLADEPLVEAGVRLAIGSTLVALGRPENAEPNLRKSLAVYRGASAAMPGERVHSMQQLANALRALDEFAGAEALDREALSFIRNHAPAGAPIAAQALNNLGLTLTCRGEFAEAERFLREALTAVRSADLFTDQFFSQVVTNLATLLMAQGKPAEAEVLLRETLASSRDALPDGHPHLAIILHNLGCALEEGGEDNKLPEAILHWREALEIQRAAMPAGHPGTVSTLTNLADALVRQGEFAEAVPLIDEALLRIRERTARDTAAARDVSDLQYLAVLYWQAGRFEQSVPMFEEVLAIHEAAFGREHEDTIHAIRDLGVNYKDSGRVAEAIPLLEEAFLGSKPRAPSDDTVIQRLLYAYSEAPDLIEPRMVAKVVTRLRAELAAQSTPEQKDSAALGLAACLVRLGITLLERDAWVEAAPPLREAIEIREKLEPNFWNVFAAKSLLGEALLGQKKRTEAEPLLLDGYHGLLQREASIPPLFRESLAQALERLVRYYEASDDNKEAAAWRSKLEAERTKLKQRNSEDKR